MRARLLLSLLPSLLLAQVGCGDDAPTTADGGADAAPPDAAPPDAAVAPRLRNELDGVPDDELALHALQLLGAPVEGAASNCDNCHGMSNGRVRSWADPLGSNALPTCFTDLEISTQEAALEMIACLRQNPEKSTSAFVTAKLGIFASAADLPWFHYLFDKAYGAEGETQYQTFRNAVLMPRAKSGRPAFGQADFDVVAEWFQRGLPEIDNRAPFDGAMADIVDEYHPEVVSFHFGLPEAALLARVRASGAKILSSATTVDEARWLEARGCDAIVAQGFEAGGHRGHFLSEEIATQVGTIALVPQVVDAVKVPVIAAGGIADARGIVAAFALGAAAVQLGTVYLFCPEARVAPPHRAALQETRDDASVLTNVFTGRPARGIVNRVVRDLGPISPLAPAFPLAAGAIAPLRAAAERTGSGDFTPLWSGQAARLGRALPAGELTRQLAAETLARL
jgi:NAD(P)H-dependent flavin oxidoreductase YrpB (nitropropane dioxygenase family)